MSANDPTAVEDQEVVPSLARLTDVVPVVATRHLVSGMLGTGASLDSVVTGVGRWLLRTIDWTDAGVPGGRLGTRGEAMLLAALRVLVEDVERGRQPPVRQRAPTPRPSVPRPAPVARIDEPIPLDPDPEER